MHVLTAPCLMRVWFEFERLELRKSFIISNLGGFRVHPGLSKPIQATMIHEPIDPSSSSLLCLITLVPVYPQTHGPDSVECLDPMTQSIQSRLVEIPCATVPPVDSTRSLPRPHTLTPSASSSPSPPSNQVIHHPSSPVAPSHPPHPFIHSSTHTKHAIIRFQRVTPQSTGLIIYPPPEVCLTLYSVLTPIFPISLQRTYLSYNHSIVSLSDIPSACLGCLLSDSSLFFRFLSKPIYLALLYERVILDSDCLLLQLTNPSLVIVFPSPAQSYILHQPQFGRT